MMLIDVDHFKQINDSIGHDAGDAVLRSFADRLRSLVRAEDTVARIGGDEFGVILAHINGRDAFENAISSLTLRLREPLQHQGRLIECRASIGVAIFPDDADTADGIEKCSDLALAAAKVSRSCAVAFRPEMARSFEREAKQLSLARGAIKDDQIAPYYQPKLDLATGAVAGFEALLRWEKPGRDPRSAGIFAPAFADRELAAAISERMIRRVLDDLKYWVENGIAPGHIAINSCSADFAANDFAERLIDALEERGLDPGLIELEVTEDVILGRGAHHVARALAVLSDRGVRIALDDFGTGYASFTHLKRLPVNALKVDRSFVAGVGKNPDDTAIVRAIISLGTNLGMQTVAEGIETEAQAAFLRLNGCNLGQGYLFGTARPASEIPALIRNSIGRMAA